MKISCICIGQTQDKEFKLIQNEYLDRLKHYASFEMIEIPNIKKAKNLTEEQLKNKEAELFEKHLNNNDIVALLDNHGKAYTSEKFAQQIEQWRFQGKNLVFLIGGAYGFANTIIQRANQKVSLSPMTFTHQMVRMIFLEQLYRAHTILKGEKYHH